MAERHAQPSDDDTPEASEAQPPEVPQPSLVTLQPDAPTIDAAFSTLRQALGGHFADDHMPSYLRTLELQMIYDNGNHVAAWQHLLPLLEQAIGAPLRTL